MKTFKSAYTLAVIFLISSAAFAQQNGNFKMLELSDKILNSETQLKQNDFNKIERVSTAVDKTGEKSPYLAAALSAVLPGAGEFYAKSYIKSAIFLAVEAGLWTFWKIKRNDGDDITQQFESYANQNWDVYKYAQWLKDQNFSGAENIDLGADKETLRLQLNAVESVHFSHTLPPYGSQQYYELIGKYQSFIAGWVFSSGVTANNYITYRPTQVDDYMGVRQDANHQYNLANASLNVIIANHILSAADAAWTVSMFNKNLKVQTGMHYEDRYSRLTGEKIMVPFGDLKVTF